MNYGYLKEIQIASVIEQVESLLSHGVGKDHIHTSLDNIPVKPGDTIFVYHLAVLGLTFGQLYKFLKKLHFQKINIFSIINTIDATDVTFLKFLEMLWDNEVIVRKDMGKRSRKKAIAAGKTPGAKKVIGPEQEKIIRELLEKNHSFKEIYEAIGVSRNTFLLWRKKNYIQTI